MMETENTNNNPVPDLENIPEDQPVDQFQDEPIAEQFQDEPVAEQFQDEPVANKSGNSGNTGTSSMKDPMKWNPTPTTIKLLVVFNLILVGAVSYVIWYAVDKERENSKVTPTLSPTASPSKSLVPSASPSQSPSAAPSTTPSAAPSPLPSVAPSAVPSFIPSSAPTTPVPTAIFSESPTRGPFTCVLCGAGKEITVDTGEVAFGDRLTRTCAELQTDADNGDIVEEQCKALYSLVVDACVCRSTATPATRTAASVRALFGSVVGSAVDFANSNEDLAADFIFSDTYYTTVVDYATDDELIQRYLLVLAFYQTSISSQLSALSGTWECEWDGITCSYGQVVGVNATNSGMSGEFPGDLFALAQVDSIDLSNNQIPGSLPTEIGQGTLLTSLDVSSNKLSGSLPTELYSLKQLTSLNLSDNLFTGSVGTDIKKLSKLDALFLNTNLLTGTLPTCDLSTKPTNITADCSEITSENCITDCF